MRVVHATLGAHEHASPEVDLLNGRVIPFSEEHEISLLRILTDRGTEYCGERDQREYRLYLALEDIGRAKTKAKNPQTNGIYESF